MHTILLLRGLGFYCPGHSSSDGDQCQRKEAGESQFLPRVNAYVPE